MRWFRKRPVFFTLLMLTVLLFAVRAIASMRDLRFEDRWTQVEVGMTKDDVQGLLGEPVQVYPAKKIDASSGKDGLMLALLFNVDHEEWAYGERRQLAAQPTFPFVTLASDGFLQPEHDDHVLIFSDDGRVIEKRYPYRARE